MEVDEDKSSHKADADESGHTADADVEHNGKRLHSLNENECGC